MTTTPAANSFEADLTLPPRALRHAWQWCAGSGHATLALRADWQAQLAQAQRDLGFRYVRFHGILDDDMGTRDPFHDSSFAAAFAARIVMSADDVVDGYSYWTFSDMFEENYFPSVPFRGGADRMPRTVTLLRIDAEHANPERAWQAMGSPAYPSSSQVAELMQASLSIAEATRCSDADGLLCIELTLAPQSVNQVRIEWSQP